MLYIRFNSRLIDDRSGSQDSGLTHIMRLVSFSTPWKHQKNFYPWEQKNFGFMFSGGRGFFDVFRWYKKRAIAWMHTEFEGCSSKPHWTMNWVQCPGLVFLRSSGKLSGSKSSNWMFRGERVHQVVWWKWSN